MTGHKREIVKYRYLVFILLGLSLAAAVFLMVRGNFFAGLISLVLPFVLIYIFYLFTKPGLGLASILLVNYFAIGLSRYIPGPLGLLLDGILVLTWLSIIFSQFNKKVHWKKASNLLSFLAALWFGYSILQFFNPEALSRVAWFYAMRGVSLYIVLSVPLIFIVYNEPRHMQLFIRMWAWFTILAVAKGLMQKYLGPDPWEDAWLDAGGGETHRLPGGLRIFSFFSDSATYGGSMGLSGVVFTVLGLHSRRRKERLFFWGVAAGAFFALLISGTRGAMAVPAAGFSIYLLLSRNFRMFITGLVIMASLYGGLKYTDIGGSIYEVRRFRSALDPENPSLMVRKENRALFKEYLGSRPFGGGIGSAGNWGLRFTPGTFLAETPPDGWYIQIWAEQGIVGLMLYLTMLGIIISRSSYLIFYKLKSEYTRAHAIAFVSGMFGLMVASFSSSALGQMPNVIIVYMSLAFVFLMPRWEEELCLPEKRF